MGSSKTGTVRPAEIDTIVYPDEAEAGDARPADSPGRIGRYVVLEVLGIGGMGVVCAAYDPKLDRRVALKLLRDARTPQGSRATAGQARLIREAQALAKLSHPNIITVHDVDTAEGKLFMAMEFVEGLTIREWLGEQQRSWREIVGVFIDAGRGLAAAHEAGLTHRDFKPSNVQIGNDGRVRVLDFGLATTGDRSMEEFAEMIAAPRSRAGETGGGVPSGVMDVIDSTGDMKLTQAGLSVGTPGYMAPEQHMGLAVDAASDQFAFGASLYEALAGRLPFEVGQDDDGGFWAAIEGESVDIPKDSGVPAWVWRVVLRALAAAPEQRWSSMNALLAALQADPQRRRRKIAGAAAAAVLVAGLAGAGAWSIAAAADREDARCKSAADRLVGIWDGPVQGAVQRAFVATDKPYAADAWRGASTALDSYSAAWVRHNEEVCRATHVRGDQSEHLLDVRMACLERGRSQLRALTEVLADADADVVLNSATAARELVALEPCLQAVQTPSRDALPNDPNARVRIDAVLGEVDRAKAQWWAGHYGEARDVAAAALEQASSLGHEPTRCAALQAMGIAQEKNREFEASRGTLRDAILCAAQVGDAQLEALSWSRLLYVLGRELRKPDAALALQLPTEAALTRAGDSTTIRGDTALYVAVTLSELGRHDEAQAKAEEAVALLRQAHGEAHASTANALGALGAILGRKGELEAAREHLEQALMRAQSFYGEHHPEVASHAFNLGNVLKNLGEPAQARELYERALQIRAEALGPRHMRVAQVHAQLGQVLGALGEGAAAQESLTQAVQILEASPGAHPRHVVSALNNLGNAQRERGEAEAARRLFERARTLLAGLGDHPQNGRTFLNLCRSQIDLGQWADARGSCSSAVEILERVDADAPALAESRTQLARARAGR